MTGLYRRGKTWWVCYWHRGQRYRFSSGSERREDAKKLRAEHMARIARGRPPGNAEERITLQELAADYIRDYEMNGRRSLEAAKIRVEHILKGLGRDTRALDITTDRVRSYIVGRQTQGAANGTINRETSALGRMFRLAVQAERLLRTPFIPKLEEPPPREGFFEHEEYQAIREHLPADLQDVLDFGFHSGWRKGEILTLRWADLDFSGEVIRLQALRSKNKQPRILPLSAPIKLTIERRLAKRVPACPFVFHRNGKPIRSMDGAWDVARAAAELPEKLMHDCRRTVARNLIRSGVSTDIARRITGHLTPSVFSRYNIVTEADIKDAAERLTVYVEEQAAKKKVLPLTRSTPA